MKTSRIILIMLILTNLVACGMANDTKEKVVEKSVESAKMTYNDAHVDFEGIELEALSVSGRYSSSSNEKANFVIDLTNQYVGNELVKLTVYFDDVLILDKSCHVGNQHFFYRYYYKTSGEHTIKVISDDGKESKMILDFDENDLNYLGVSYLQDRIDMVLFHEEIEYALRWNQKQL